MEGWEERGAGVSGRRGGEGSRGEWRDGRGV